MSDLNKQTSAPQGNLGFVQLIAMIIGSTIGAGIFTTIGDMAANGAFSGAVLIGWGIAGIGMLALSLCFFGLNKVRPDLTNGVYSYAKEGFGEYVGFNSAWGYWLSALLCNVSYTTLLFGSIGYFLPMFGAGNNLLSVVCASVIIWILNFLVLRGVKEAAGLNIITTIAKLVPLAVFLVSIVFIGAFDFDIFKHNFWGDGSMSLLDQIKGTTGATVWSFIGVEGAVVLSARAKKSSDVGKASVMGFLGLLTIYVLVAVLSLGVMPAEEIAKLDNPQLAGILEAAVGPWGATLVNLGVILSLAGALLGWTIIAADCPYSAAKQGVFMKAFARDNKHGSPEVSLFITNGIIQAFLIIVYFNASTYQLFYNLSASMIMIPYLFSALYYAKVTFKKEGMIAEYSVGALTRERIFAIVGSIYGVWMLYSGGLSYLLATTILYAFGLIVFVLGRKERGEKPFKAHESIIAIAIVALAIISVVMIAKGSLKVF